MFTFSGQGGDTVLLASNKGSENRFRAYKNSTVMGNPNGYPYEFTLYKLEGGSGGTTVAAPQASPQAGSVTSGTQITLSTTTSGATIYYTLNGDEPTGAASTTEFLYSAPFAITGDAGDTVTLKAIAVKDGVTSAVQTISYTIRAESEPPIKGGDQVVIYAPAYNKALSSEKTSFYNVGTDVSFDSNGVMSGYDANDIWTVVANTEDGTYSFQQNGQNIGLADQYNSMNLGAVNDRWKLIDLGNGLYNIQNAGRGNYMEWYNSENNWSTYNSNSAATDGQFQLAFYKVTGDIPDPSEPEVPIKAGDKVGIYLPSEQLVITTTANSYGERLVGAAATLENNELTTEADNAEFTVSGNNTEGFTFVSADGKYLTTSDSGKTLTMADASSDYSLWILESNGSGGWFIKNKNAAYNDNAQYIEYFNSNFTTYSKYSNSDTAIYSFQFYPIAGEGSEDGMPIDVFFPDGSMTRAMFWTVLARIDGADTSGGLEWYSAAQKWAISEGVSDGTEPNALITREQLATMLWRYAGEPEGNSTLDGFTDSGSVSYWAYDALVWAVENGIVTGMGDGILAPQGTATRAQAATMFMRYMSVVK